MQCSSSTVLLQGRMLSGSNSSGTLLLCPLRPLSCVHMPRFHQNVELHNNGNLIKPHLITSILVSLLLKSKLLHLLHRRGQCLDRKLPHKRHQTPPSARVALSYAPQIMAPCSQPLQPSGTGLTYVYTLLACQHLH